MLSYEYKKPSTGKQVESLDMEYESTPIIDLNSEIEKLEKVVEDTQPKNLGNFKLTAYCACSKCCGKWAGTPTASGVMPKANRTIAVDTSVIPFGTKVIINGRTYVAEDTGSAIKGNRIDVYFDNHEAALQFGVKYADVFKIK